MQAAGGWQGSHWLALDMGLWRWIYRRSLFESRILLGGRCTVLPGINQPDLAVPEPTVGWRKYIGVRVQQGLHPSERIVCLVRGGHVQGDLGHGGLSKLPFSAIFAVVPFWMRSLSSRKSIDANQGR